MRRKKVKILLAGGGSGGPVAPLLAVAREIRENYGEVNPTFLLVGTSAGPERVMAANESVEFKTIPTAKLRRYFSVKNLLLPFELLFAFLKSLYIVLWFRPNIIFGAGSFVQVPLMFVGFFLGAKIIVHQQDVEVSLSNYLCSFLAKRITVTFKESEKDFPESFLLSGLRGLGKTRYTGNPSLLPDKIPSRKEALKVFGLEEDLPVVLVFGGGTGANGLNELIFRDLAEICKSAQVVHAYGKGKGKEVEKIMQPHYHPYEFITDMASAYAAADVVIGRCGLSTITELSKYKKMSILFPMPNSHQEANAELVSERKAAIVLEQHRVGPGFLAGLIKKLNFQVSIQKTVTKNISELMPKDANSKVAEIILGTLLK